jgi:hypothetical protein
MTEKVAHLALVAITTVVHPTTGTAVTNTERRAGPVVGVVVNVTHGWLLTTLIELAARNQVARTKR